MKTLLAILFVASAIACLGGTIDPDTPDEKHVTYGSQFHCVAKISCKDLASGGRAVASCVVINPHWVVTAAHCVAGGEDFCVDIDGNCFPLSRVISHAKFTGRSLDGNDIAVGYSEKDFGLDAYPGLYSGSDEAGSVVSIAGYGVTGTFTAGYRSGAVDGKRRAGSNIVDHVTTTGLLICSASPAKRTDLEYLISPGDSGGGLFIGDDLAGVNSCLLTEKKVSKGTYGDESGHTRISAHREWINERIKSPF